MKNPAAVELGRRGGLKGGKARAERMTAEQRSSAARKAANSRWRKTSDNEEAIEIVEEMIYEGFEPEEMLVDAREEQQNIDKQIAMLREDRDSLVYTQEAIQLYLTLKKLRKD